MIAFGERVEVTRIEHPHYTKRGMVVSIGANNRAGQVRVRYAGEQISIRVSEQIEWDMVDRDILNFPLETDAIWYKETDLTPVP